MADWNNILIAVDEMESSLRAVRYVGQIARNVENVSICLLHVYPEPPPDFHQKGGVLEEYQAQRIVRAEHIFEQMPGDSDWCRHHSGSRLLHHPYGRRQDHQRYRA